MDLYQFPKCISWNINQYGAFKKLDFLFQSIWGYCNSLLALAHLHISRTYKVLEQINYLNQFFPNTNLFYQIKCLKISPWNVLWELLIYTKSLILSLQASPVTKEQHIFAGQTGKEEESSRNEQKAKSMSPKETNFNH